MNVKNFFAAKTVGVAALVLVGALIGFSLAFFPMPGRDATAFAESSPATTVNPNALAVAQQLQQAINEVSTRVLPSVVEITTIEIKKQQMPNMDGTPWKFFFNIPEGQEQEREYRASGLGSGIVVRRNGNTYYVLTNAHVIGEANEINVVLNDEREFKARLVGKDTRKDLALVSFESKDAIPIAVLGDSDSVKVGDWAIAIGNPLGYLFTTTMGIVSAVGRSGAMASNINDFIQTDASINKGNSGGPLLNIRGEVVGINTWIASGDISGGSVGLGFAIPINNAKRVIDQFISNGVVKYGWIGVSLLDISKEMAVDLGVGEAKGAFASQVFIGSPAQKGGVQPGDFIVEVNGKPIKDTSQLILVVADLAPGQKANFTLIRDGKRQTVVVQIEERKDSVASDAGKLWPGVVVVPLFEEIRKEAKIDAKVTGLFVASAEPKSPAALLQVLRGDVITSVNGVPVQDLRSFYRVLAEKAQKELWFEVVREGTKLETLHFKR